MAAIAHKTKVGIIELLLKPEQLKPAPGQPNVWGREIKLLNGLLKVCPDPQFWMDLHLGYTLNSLAFFLSERGRQELDHAWRLHLYVKAQDQKGLDTQAKPPTMDSDPVVTSVTAADLEAPLVSRRRLSPIAWADAVVD